MKKLVIFGAMALTSSMLIFSCQKEVTNPSQPTAENGQAVNSGISAKQTATVVTKKKAYKWVGSLLDCSADGTGCEVAAFAVSANATIDLSVVQVLKLIEIGNVDLNTYFKQNKLDDVFPGLYEGRMRGQIASGKVNLVFEFPYLFVYDNKGTSQSNLVEAYNYEATLSDNSVITALKQAAAPAGDKKAELNTDVNNPVVWKCINAGDNCKTKASATLRFYPEWITANYQYLYVTTLAVITSAKLTPDRGQVQLIDAANNIFVVEL